MVPAKTDNAYISMDEWFLEFAGRDNDNEGSNVLVGNGANRDPNEESVMANMLRQIKYPTGGSTDFTFEANDFESNMGGVRVLKVVDNPVQGLAKEAMYSYSGYSYFDPRDHYYSYYQVAYDLNARSSPTQTALNIFGVPYEQGTTNVTVKYYKVSLQPQAILGTGSQVGYSTVTVKTVGNGSETSIYADQSEYPDYTTRDAFNEGSTQELNMVNSMYIAEYIDDTDFPTPGGNSMRKTSGGYGLWPYPEHYSNDWKRGVISSKIVKSENGTIVRREEYTYNRKILDTICGWKVYRFGEFTRQYVYAKYILPSTLIQMKSSELTDYDASGQNPMTVKSDYFYDNSSHYSPTRIETTRSDGKKEVVAKSYPLDYGDDELFIKNMKSNHVLQYPIETARYIVDGTSTFITYGTVKTYDLAGKGLVQKEYNLEAGAPIPLSSFKFSNRSTGILPSSGSVSAFAFDSRYREVAAYNMYSSAGRLLQYQKYQDYATSYIWNDSDGVLEAVIKNDKEYSVLYGSFESSAGWSGEFTYDKQILWSGRQSGKITNNTSAKKSATSSVLFVNTNNNTASSRKFVFSGWVYSDAPVAEIRLVMKDLTETTPAVVESVQTSVRNKWIRIQKEVMVPAQIKRLIISLDNNGGGSVWFDDIMIHPVSGFVSTYTFKPFVGMTSESDANGKYTFFEYDIFGRLLNVRDNDRNILKRYDYQFGFAGTFRNAEKYAYFFRNCPAGSQSLSSTKYTVPEGRYVSTVSQDYVDKLAADDITANGQNYADSVGVCTYYSFEHSGYFTKQGCQSGASPTTIYYSILAGRATSTISQEDADNKAMVIFNNEGQSKVNTEGQCIVQMPVYYSNPNFVTGYQVEFYNLDSGVSSWFYIGSNNPTGFLGTISSGNYNVSITSGETTSRYFSAGCEYNNGYGSGGMEFSNIYLSPTCDVISIN